MSNVVKFTDDDDADLAALLRSELGKEAARVRPSDRFETILAETAKPARSNGFRWLAVAAALLLVVGVSLPFVMHQLNSQAPPAQSPAASAPMSPTSGASLPSMQIGLPVFYVDPQTNLFYQERLNLPTQTNALVTAVNAVLNVVPSNPQFVSRWKGGTVNSAQVVDGKIVVNLTSASYTALKDTAQAKQAAFQIYDTVNAVLSAGSDSLPVVLQSDGSSTVPLLGDTAVAGFWNNPPAMGPVWISSPQASQRIAAGDLPFSGFILTGNDAPKLTITKASSGAQVATPTVTLGAKSGQWQAWSASVNLTAGDYQAAVSADGTEHTVLFSVTS